MKVAVVLFAIIGLGLAAPQPKKLFHEHFEEFLDIIMEKAGNDIELLMENYVEFDEFVAALDYMKTKNFKDLVYEMESLPEFQAVVEFLENDNIDIHFFIDKFNDILATIDKRRLARHSLSGTNFAAFIEDCISEFPKTELAALYDQKIAEDEGFRTAIENLKSEEWDTVFSALWKNEVFQAEVETLASYGIDIHGLLHEVVAVFGQ